MTSPAASLGQRRPRGWTGLIVTAAVVFGLPALISPQLGRQAFDSGTADSVAHIDPDYVLIGNSMLQTRIIPEYLGDLAGGKEVLLLVDSGLTSAGWYLRLKNHVAGTGVRPDAVFIFFRDDSLTDPMRRTGGPYRDKLERLRTSSEPAYDAVISANSGIGDALTGLFARLYPVQNRSAQAEDAIRRIAASPSMPGLLPDSALHLAGLFDGEDYLARLADYNRLKRDANAVFERTNFRTTGASRGESGETLPFQEAVEDSFLPLMLDVARRYDIPLVFVRVQRRPAADGTMTIPGGEALGRYLVDLRAYLEANEASMLDMTGDPELPLALYLDGDHIAPEYMDDYTELFFRRAASYFK